MAGTFSDQAELAQLFQQSLSPITTYSQGALALAMQDRQQRLQAATLAQQNAARLEQEKQIETMRQTAETQRADAANKAVLDRWKVEHELLDKDAKEKERREAIQKANAIGAELPPGASFEDASQAYVDLHGMSYIEANKRMGAALSGVLRQTGTDPKAFAARVANMIADDPTVVKALTIEEREAIRKNPQKLADYRSQFAKDSKKKYEAYAAAMSQASQTVIADFEKEAASKPELVRATADLRQASQALEAIRKESPIPWNVESDAFKAYSDAANPPLPPPPPVRERLPLPGAGAAGVNPAGTTPATPAAAAPAFSGILPAIGSTLATAGRNLYQGGKIIAAPAAALFRDANALLWTGGPYENPAAAAVNQWNQTFYPAAPVDPQNPSNLAADRLAEFRRQSAAINNNLFRTAFPAGDITATPP